ncbi:MAG: hypothetical protein HRU69_03930 [Flammeovirgaceae bacterium]|jgi:hypothetical protein|nr:MAG: hypothetical protein HRU69_03930 [Flammeovirgaceae bacterium]
MRKYLFISTLILLSCNDNIEQFKDIEIIRNAVVDVDKYYSSNEAKSASIGQMHSKIYQISQIHDVKIIPLTYAQYLDFYYNWNSLRVQSCSGQPVSIEVVDEGNGCIGIVRKYSDYSASITSYCFSNGSVSAIGTTCYSE